MGVFVSFMLGMFQTPAMAGFASPPPPPPDHDKALLAGVVVGALLLALFLSGCREA